MPTETTPPEMILPGVKNAASANAKIEQPRITNRVFLISPKTLDFEILRLSSVPIFSLHLEIGEDEGVNFSVHDARDIRGLIVGSVIFNQCVRTEDVTSNLASPLNVFLLADDGLHFRVPLFELLLHEFIRQHLHTSGFIHQLASLDFTLNDNARGKVRDSHGRGDFVNVLTTGTSAAEGVDFQIFGIDHHVRDAPEFGNDVDGSERRMATRVGVEGGNADQTVNAFLAFQ